MAGSTMSKGEKIGVWIMGVGCLHGLAALWWWPVFGMSEEVGIASGATSLALIVIGFSVVSTVATLKKESKKDEPQ
jgi:hypothetical protein